MAACKQEDFNSKKLGVELHKFDKFSKFVQKATKNSCAESNLYSGRKTRKNYALRRNTHVEENTYHKKEFKVQRGTSILTACVGSRVMPGREGCSSHQLATSSFCFLCYLPVNIVCAYKSVVVSKSTLLLKTKVMRAFVNERSPQTKKDGLLCLFRDIIH